MIPRRFRQTYSRTFLSVKLGLATISADLTRFDPVLEITYLFNSNFVRRSTFSSLATKSSHMGLKLTNTVDRKQFVIQPILLWRWWICESARCYSKKEVFPSSQKFSIITPFYPTPSSRCRTHFWSHESGFYLVAKTIASFFEKDSLNPR